MKIKDSRFKVKNIVLVVLTLILLCGFYIIVREGIYKKNVVKKEVPKQNKIHHNKKKENSIKKDVPEDNIKNQPGGQYTPWTVKREDGKKVAYLTFDDGPSVNTSKIIEILNRNNIKATFFLIGKSAEEFPDMVRQEFQNGEVIGNHTYSHILSNKSNPEKLIEDFNKCDGVLRAILGKNYNSKLARFPGGSFGDRLRDTREAVGKAGYRFVDWNDEIGDARGRNLPVSILLQNLRKYTYPDTIVLLMHDAAPKTSTVEALPQIIQYLKDRGYTFSTL
ncbi:polysaccharide deacetylase [Clostridium acetobutylicum]|nr:polysaccharide deacetylase [Clostridium acetobutylicum]